MKIVLATMPWQAINSPSLAISILDTLATQLGHTVVQHYGNLRFAELLLAEGAGEISPDYFLHMGEQSYDRGIGEWIFTSSLYEPGWRLDRFVELMTSYGYDRIDTAIAVHRCVPDFVRGTAARVLEEEPDLVGITSTFEQNVASLALAKELKRIRPELPIVLGGNNCDGPMGAALHRNFPQLDFVVRGEGEVPFVALLDALEGRKDFKSVPALCWRDSDGVPHENVYTGSPLPGAKIPSPNFTPYFSGLDDSAARPWIARPTIRLESSRGCWWGERRHCTFCGLNDATLGYRSKPADVAWREIRDNVTKFGVLDVVISDNIMDPAYVDSLLPRIANEDWDLSLFYEVKSNLKAPQLEALVAAGVSMVQPGIESLSTGPLSLMGKGASGAGQVGALRLFAEHGIFPTWHYLHGFPGEDWDRDYQPVLDQLPFLVHLPSPASSARVILERFAPLFEDPSLGIDDPRVPTRWYPIVYDLPPEEIVDLAYAFDYRPRGINEVQAALFTKAIGLWQEHYESSSLTYLAIGDRIVISDRRFGLPEEDFVLEGVEAAAYLTLTRHLTARALQAAMKHAGYDVDLGTLNTWLTTWSASGLVYRDGDAWISLAVRHDPRRRSHWEDADDTATV